MSLKDRIKEQDEKDRMNFQHRQYYSVCTILGDSDFDVHLSSCRDVKRGIALGKEYRGSNAPRGVRQYGDCASYEADSVKDVVDNEIRELNHDFGEGVWDATNFHIMPCIKEKR